MEGTSSSHSNSTAKLKVGGLWSGVIEVDLEQWTVSMLRAELGKRSVCDPDGLNVICAGKILKKEIAHKSLREAGVKNGSKILLSKVAVDQGKAIHDELQAQHHLDRLKAAVDAMAKRHSNGSFPVDEFSIELENQRGEKMSAFSDTDQRAVKMGLMLHANGRNFITNGQYREALKIFDMGEEAFSQCNPKILEMVDNVPLLQIEIVWCYFMLRDISCLAMAGIRLKEARKGLERCYGSNMERARVLQGGFCPELAIFTRLELLEGVVAYHTGLLEESHKALQAAQKKYEQLQVSDEALSQLVSMGYTEQQSKRALRMAGQDIQRAVEFAIEEKETINKRREEDARRKQEIREQRSYGETPMRKGVDMALLDKLVSIGYERILAAEALRKNENDMQIALDELTDPASNSALQDAVQSRRRKKRKTVRDEDIAEIMSMGFEREKVLKALLNSSTKEHAIDFLLRELQTLDANTGAARTSEEVMQLESSAFEEERQPDNITDVANQMEDDAEYQNSSAPIEDRDDEMEGVIVDNLSGDPLADYDIEVEEEGKAILEYLTLLASACDGQ